MSRRTLYVVVPGDIDSRTGGYGYDRAIIAGLGARGWDVRLVSLPGEYPFPTLSEQEQAASLLASIPEGACVMVDGLALGVLPDVAAREHNRLRLLGLVHHPLGLETGLDPFVAQLLIATEQEALRHVRGVVVTSPGTVEAVVELGVLPEHVAVVEPGTAPAQVAAGSGDGVPHLLCVASLTPRKGHDTLLDALERLQDLPWRLTCVGGFDRHSAYATHLRERVAAGPLAGRVALVGELAGAALDAAYHSADLFVLATRYEGYGMVVAEALARALPVVSTPTGAIPDLIGEGAGVLVPADDAAALADALARLLSDSAALQRLRDGAGRVRSSLRTWETAAAGMEDAVVRFTGA